MDSKQSLSITITFSSLVVRPKVILVHIDYFVDGSFHISMYSVSDHPHHTDIEMTHLTSSHACVGCFLVYKWYVCMLSYVMDV